MCVCLYVYVCVCVCVCVPGAYGGRRWTRYGDAQQNMIEYHAWQVLRYDPKYVQSHMHACHVYVCACYVCVCVCMCVYVCVCRYTLYALRVLLRTRLGVDVSRAWLSRMLSRWRWSFKNLNHKHVHKFTPHNIACYGQYLTHIHETCP